MGEAGTGTGRADRSAIQELTMEGWKCPVCGRGVSPQEKTCDHNGNAQAVPVYYGPLLPVGPGTPVLISSATCGNDPNALETTCRIN